MAEAKTENKYITGFCGIGCHEGTKPKSFSGKPMKTCTYWQTCSCSCHKMITRMFEETGLSRIPVENPEYVPVKSNFVMPERQIVIAAPILSNSAPVLPPETLESVAPGIVPPTNRATYGPTQSGRAARGELEHWVEDTCSTWVVEQEQQSCTPVYISEEIAKKQGIRTPSTGAITAVLERWVLIGFAKIERKPIRFVGFTEDAIKYGLEEMKSRANRLQKSKSRQRTLGPI